jgi:methylated-DNA-protein-cysteine methyltransferase related protein
VLKRLTDEESASLPRPRVVGAEARTSPNRDPILAQLQCKRLEAEGLRLDTKGFIQNSDTHFHVVGIRRDIRWSDD